MGNCVSQNTTEEINIVTRSTSTLDSYLNASDETVYMPIDCNYFNNNSIMAARKLKYENNFGGIIKEVEHKFTYLLED